MFSNCGLRKIYYQRKTLKSLKIGLILLMLELELDDCRTE